MSIFPFCTFTSKRLNAFFLTFSSYIQATHAWIKAQVEADVAAGSNVAGLASSEVVVQVTDTLDQLKH